MANLTLLFFMIYRIIRIDLDDSSETKEKLIFFYCVKKKK